MGHGVTRSSRFLGRVRAPRSSQHWYSTTGTDTQLGQPGLVRHGLRHTALIWMADTGVDLHILQRVAGHQDPAVTARYLHPGVQAMLEAGTAFSAWWSIAGPERPSLGVIDGGKNVG